VQNRAGEISVAYGGRLVEGTGDDLGSHVVCDQVSKDSAP
jgi:hypothetical protein